MPGQGSVPQEEKKQSWRSTRQQHATPLGTAGREKQSCRSTGQQHATPLVRRPVQHREIPTAVQTQLGSTHQYTCMLAPMTHQKKGVLDKRDFRKSFNYLCSDDSTFQPEQRARLPNFFANRVSAEVAEGSVQQAWCEQRARYPLPTETDRVSATRKTNITAQNSLSRGPDYPTFM